MTLTYLDWNATAPLRPEAIEAVTRRMQIGGNASAVHRHGREARQAVERARAQVAALVGAAPDDVVFTSGGTEADNLALRGIAGRRLMVSAIEHGAILAPALIHDPEAVLLPVDGAGVLDLAALEAALAAADRPALVSVMLANNETGVVQPLAEVAAIARRHGALVHSDCVQAAGKLPLDMAELGVDMLSLSAHKLGGPQGTGALVLRGALPLQAVQIGGGQEQGRRSGTENVPGIVGFGEAAAAAAAELAAEGVRLAALRDGLEGRLRETAKDLTVFGAAAPRLPNTSCLSMPGVPADSQVMAFDLEDVAVSAGAACSSGKVAASHVLAAMDVEDALARTAIRVSLGRTTTADDVDRFVAVWREIYRRCGGRRNAA